MDLGVCAKEEDVIELTNEIVRRMYLEALEAYGHAYAPYTRHPMGAAVLSGSGNIYTGINCETVACTGTHAEQGAIHDLRKAGETRLEAVLVLGGKKGPEPCDCCGLCLQALREFGTDVKIIFAISVSGTEVEYTVLTLAEVLTRSFGPDALGK